MRADDATADGPGAGKARIPRELDAACHLNVMLPGIGFEAGEGGGASPASGPAPRLDAALAGLASAGYRRVVMPPVDPERFDAAGLGTLCGEHGLAAIPIAGQAPGADVSSGDPAERAAGVAALRRMVDLTVELGGDQLNGVPYGLFERAAHAVPRQALLRSAAAVGEAAEYAYERGVTMTFEVLNRYETPIVNTAEQAMAFADASGSEHLRIHLDTFHMLVEEADIGAAIRTAMPRLYFLELGQSGRGPLSEGALDIAGLVRSALDDGYRGRWGIEAFSAAVLPEPAQAALAIWREPYRDGIALAREAAALIGEGWERRRSAPR